MPDQTQINYRQCFTTLSGRLVLTDMLMAAGFFDDDLKTPEEIAVENFVKGILHKAGVYDKERPDHQRMVVNTLMEVPLERNDNDKGNQES